MMDTFVKKPLVDKTLNQINVIYPFKNTHGTWVFTDKDVDLYEEPFVSNVNPIIETVVKGNKFTAFISHSPIAGEQLILDRVDEIEGESVGNGWYQLRGTEMICWLCPASQKYFNGYVPEIHVKIEE